MKKWVCSLLAAAVLVFGLGVAHASAAVVRYRGFVGVRAWPAVRAAHWAPRALIGPPVYVAPRRAYFAPPVYVAPPPVYVPAPSMYY